MVRELKDGRIEECIFSEIKMSKVIEYEAHVTVVKSLLIKFTNGTSISFVIDDIIDYEKVKGFIYRFLSYENDNNVKEMTQAECKKFLEEGINSLIK